MDNNTEMLDPEELKAREFKRQETVRRELQRKSLDTIRVFNPTDEDHPVEWDGYFHRVPSKNKDLGWGKGMRLLPRYLAIKFAREMKDKLIHRMQEQMVKEMLERMDPKSRSEYQVDPFSMQKLYDKTPRTSDKKLIAKIYAEIWMGIEEEYGKEAPEETPTQKSADIRTSEEQILAQMFNKKSTYNPNKPTEVYQPEIQRVVEEQPEVSQTPKYPLKSKKQLAKEMEG